MAVWEWVEGAAGTVAEWLVVAWTVLVAAGALLLVATAIATRLPGVRRVVGAIPAVRRARQPQLRVEAFDGGAVEGGAGAWLVAALRGAMPRQIAMGVGDDLAHVDGRSELVRALSGLKQVSPAAGLVLGAVSAAGAILPRNSFVLSGALQPDTGDGVGLALLLQRGSTVEGVVTLTPGALTPGQHPAAATPASGGAPAELARLVEPAASWVQYCITRALDGSTAIASDGEGFVLFREGVRCEQEDPIQARLLYQRALELDPTNAGALANLGQLNDRDGDREHAIADLERSLALLQLPPDRHAPRDASSRLLATSDVDRKMDRDRATPIGSAGGRQMAPRFRLRDFHRNPDWYRIKYSLAVLYSERLSDGTGELDDVADTARKNALGLAIAADHVGARLRRWPWRRRPGSRELADFLEVTAAPCARILLADVLLEEGKRAELTEKSLDEYPGNLLPPMKAALNRRRREVPPSIAELIASVSPKRNRLSPRSLYNRGFLLAKIALACADSQAEAWDQTEARDRMRAQAQAQTRDQTEKRDRTEAPTKPHAVAGEEAIAAFKLALKRSDDLGRYTISEHASREATLARFRRVYEDGQRLSDLFESHRKPPNSAALAELPTIGDAGAKALADVGIVSWRGLKRLRSDSVRARLALEVGEQTIEEWLDCYDLLLLDGLGIGHLRTLHAAGHRSRATLAEADAAKLRRQIEALDGEHVVPSSELLEAWVAEAGPHTAKPGGARSAAGAPTP